jgi:DNA-binding NtrC family response regulator
MRAKILLVEDDASLVELVTYNLEKEGFDVVRTGDGEEALTLAEEEKPDPRLDDRQSFGHRSLPPTAPRAGHRQLADRHAYRPR